jgi:hypothetical protein
MGYRGEDLDLRTPQTWSASVSDLAGGIDSRGRSGGYQGRSGPIWVDETLLACCNHAYEQALLNRAGEVRLEHLIHAMTRIDAAAEALETRGVRVAALRRDAATAIASDIPIALANGKGTPRRSDAFEETLRLAAGNAARRNSPAGIDDILHVLLDVETGFPGAVLLTRNLARPSFAEPPMRSPYIADPRPADYEALRPRQPAPAYYPADPPRTARTDVYGTPTDSIQNSRLDALEQMVRALGNDLSNERKAFQIMLQDLQRDVAAHRDENGRLSSALGDRLQSVDALIERRLGELSRPWLQMNDRLQGIEHVVSRGGAPDLGPIADRIGAIERAVQNIQTLAPDMGPMLDRLTSLEEAIERTRSLTGVVEGGYPAEGLAGLQRLIEAGTAETGKRAEALVERVKGLEQVLAARPAIVEGQIDLAPLTQRLDMIEEAVLSREATTREISDRLRQQEDVLAADRAMMEERSEKIVRELRTIAGLIDKESDETASAVLDSLSARLEGLAGVIEGRHSDTAQALASNSASLAQLIERIGAAEKATQEQLGREEELQKSYMHELKEVHEALIKLNANQHTLSGSIDQWRQDTASMLSIMGSRMETVERETAKPVAMLSSMGQTIDRMHRVTVERYYRRNRFWYWLFGTDDWVAASWPAHATRIADDARLSRPSVPASVSKS